MPCRWPVTKSEILQSLIQILLVHKEQHDLSNLVIMSSITKAHVFEDWFSAGGALGR